MARRFLDNDWLHKQQTNEFNKKGEDYFRKSGPEILLRRSGSGLLRSDKNIEDSVLYFFSEAIRIDSTNKGTYWTKLAFENYYNRTDDAKKTAQLYYRKFNDPHGLISLGGIHLKLGDTIQSKKYFKQALLFYETGIKSRKFIEDSILMDLSLVNLFNGDTTISR